MNTAPENIAQHSLSIAEHHGEPFRCGHCDHPCADGAGYVVSIVQSGGAVPVDGIFCCENCAADEANGIEIVDA